jgi:hypothetical protein
VTLTSSCETTHDACAPAYVQLSAQEGFAVAAQCGVPVGTDGPALYWPRRPRADAAVPGRPGTPGDLLSASRAAEDADFDPIPRFVEREFRRYLECVRGWNRTARRLEPAGVMHADELAGPGKSRGPRQ